MDDNSSYIGWPEAVAALGLRSAMRARSRGYITIHVQNGRRLVPRDQVEALRNVAARARRGAPPLSSSTRR